MAQDILITPNRDDVLVPKIDFDGLNAQDIRLEVQEDGSIAFVGTSGTLFKIEDDLTDSLFSVNDISGIPILEVFADEDVFVYGRLRFDTAYTLTPPFHFSTGDAGRAPTAASDMVLETTSNTYFEFITESDGVSGFIFSDTDASSRAVLNYDIALGQMNIVSSTAFSLSSSKASFGESVEDFNRSRLNVASTGAQLCLAYDYENYYATFGVDSAGLLTISTIGNRVGIEISPVSILHVYQNDSGVSTGSGITIEQDGAGDAALQFLLTSQQRWVMGIDNSITGDPFVIASNADLASSVCMTITTAGKVTIPTSFQYTTSATNQSRLITDASGNASWSAPWVAKRNMGRTTVDTTTYKIIDFTSDGLPGVDFSSGSDVTIVCTPSWTTSFYVALIGTTSFRFYFGTNPPDTTNYQVHWVALEY